MYKIKFVDPEGEEIPLVNLAYLNSEGEPTNNGISADGGGEVELFGGEFDQAIATHISFENQIIDFPESGVKQIVMQPAIYQIPTAEIFADEEEKKSPKFLLILGLIILLTLIFK